MPQAGTGPEAPLSVRLRHASAPDHRALEDTIGPLQGRMCRDRYGAMLLMFRALHALAAALHDGFPGACAAYGVAPPRPGLVAAIDHDLAVLGWSAAGSFPAIAQDLYPSFAAALGAFYVAEGSALGNVLLLRQSDSWLAAAPGTATRFLNESAQAAGPRFQAFRQGLDAFGLAQPRACNAVLDGARRTFRACGAMIEGSGRRGGADARAAAQSPG
jgi:heme oxygenase